MYSATCCSISRSHRHVIAVAKGSRSAFVCLRLEALRCAGCAFGEGDADAVRANATTAELLCTETELDECTFEDCFGGLSILGADDLWECLNALPRSCGKCTADHRGTGACYASTFAGSFGFVKPVRS